MTKSSWTAFVTARLAYRDALAKLEESLPGLKAAQQALVDARIGGSFPVETPVVYNSSLDAIGPKDDIKIILVADNPGRREQAAENRRYLVGPSGKLADGFFRSHPELGIDFRKNVLILNKTPIHTPRTAELRELARIGGEHVKYAIAESQRTMVNVIRAFHVAFDSHGGKKRKSAIPLWIIGYSELGKAKLFEPFARALGEAYKNDDIHRGAVLLFRHFSMNQFSVDIKKRALSEESMTETLARVGKAYRLRELGW